MTIVSYRVAGVDEIGWHIFHSCHSIHHCPILVLPSENYVDARDLKLESIICFAYSDKLFPGILAFRIIQLSAV